MCECEHTECVDVSGCLFVMQGPCSLNQLALAHSRLWDAVGGFLYIFANMQDKLSKVRNLRPMC